MYHSYVSVKPACTTLSYSFFLWKYTVFKNFKKLLHIFSYVTTRGSNLIDFIYKYVRRNAYFGRRFKKNKQNMQSYVCLFFIVHFLNWCHPSRICHLKIQYQFLVLKIFHSLCEFFLVKNYNYMGFFFLLHITICMNLICIIFDLHKKTKENAIILIDFQN